jgi:hypothetical protein
MYQGMEFYTTVIKSIKGRYYSNSTNAHSRNDVSPNYDVSQNDVSPNNP